MGDEFESWKPPKGPRPGNDPLLKALEKVHGKGRDDPKQLPSQKLQPTASDTPQDGLSTEFEGRKPSERVGALRGGALLDMMADIKNRHKLIRNFTYIAAQLEKDINVVRKLYFAEDFTPEMEALIRTEDLTLEMAFALQPYPQVLRAPIARIYKSTGRTPTRLRRIFIRAGKDAKETLQSLLEKEGVEWSKSLNSDGTPKSEKDRTK